MFKLKKDKYKSARGGHSRLYKISCESCGAQVCVYQKDGPGALRRMYVDRMFVFTPAGKDLVCVSCKKTIGIGITYEKENRPAYRLFEGSVRKQMTTTV